MDSNLKTDIVDIISSIFLFALNIIVVTFVTDTYNTMHYYFWFVY